MQHDVVLHQDAAAAKNKDVWAPAQRNWRKIAGSSASARGQHDNTNKLVNAGTTWILSLTTWMSPVPAWAFQSVSE